ncbi:MAG TPA: hypothetical protein VFX45_11910 [Solirubrobacterales bacterium]|nr:hypothetical protein [Solirubrobacterales bacterium]
MSAIVAFALIAWPSSAGADVVSGSDLSGKVSVWICEFPMTTTTCTLAISDLSTETQAAGGPKAAIDGVIVSWSVRSAVNTVETPIRLHLVRGHTGVAVGAWQLLPMTAGIHSFPARLPVSAGDGIAIDAETAPMHSIGVISNGTFEGTSGFSLDFWVPQLGPTETRDPNWDDFGYELLVNVTIEPDLDGDGFGDETQDASPGSPPTQSAGPPAPTSTGSAPIPTEPVPQTTIGKGPKGTVTSAKATFRFSSSVSGSTFQCKLDKKPWKQCKSPKAYTNLAEGEHHFAVRAVGPTGVPDPTPAKRSFKVEL